MTKNRRSHRVPLGTPVVGIVKVNRHTSRAPGLRQGAAAERRPELRTGVHLGDVAVEGQRRYGDGVTIAARLERLAPPSGICLSEIVRTQAHRKLHLALDDLVPQKIKGFPDPIRVYAITHAKG